MLTLYACRRMLWQYASNVAFDKKTAQDDANFDLRLAQVLDRFFTVGEWKSMWRRVKLTVYGDTINGNTLTLPRNFDSCDTFSPLCGSDSPIYSRFHEFVAFSSVGTNGSNGCCDGWLPCASGMKLSNDAAQTFVVPSGTFFLRFVTEASDGYPIEDGIILSGGFNGSTEYFDSRSITLAVGTVDDSRLYTELPFIMKAVTPVALSVYAVDEEAVQTLIAVYAPGETIPEYRQYLVSGSATGNIVRCNCKLRMTIPTEPNDIVVPNNIGAIKMGFFGLQYEDTNDWQRAAEAWGPNYPEETPGRPWGAFDLLDAELRALQAAEVPAFKVAPDFGAGAIPNIT